MSVRLSAVCFSATSAIVIDLLGTIVELVCQNILQVNLHNFKFSSNMGSKTALEIVKHIKFHMKAFVSTIQNYFFINLSR